MTGRSTTMQRLGLDRDGASARVVDVNDGIIATGGIVEGLAGAGVGGQAIVLAAAAALLAGALSLGGAKYAEAAAEREVQFGLLEEERRLLELSPAAELAELAEIYRARGLSPETAARVAEELSATDALRAHAEAEYGISGPTADPWPVAVGAGLSFALGAAVPLTLVLLTPTPWEGAMVYASTLLALCLTSWIVARVGRTGFVRVARRAVVVGGLALGLSWLGGQLFAGP
ncbi:hypothetical protein FDO65_00130 [Nakamurella flava]|uniref:VIT family protein n=1 Tax=Nakamurella flava TaxID=2576308 RepID=A0A4U6QIH6_9ACTN|nr:VIT1/CCC1 transporter family protein [Nakamurella flava]TKV60183.1 hypothetical protein FDO65_00130 [Nakamurella flava]